MTVPFSQAHWIWTADRGDARYSVRRFRNKFKITQNAEITVNVSADSRYILYLDGKRIARGPAKSDIRHYNYESCQLSLSAGEHVVAAIVLYYDSSVCPVSEMHQEGAFVLEIQDEAGNVVSATGVGDSWLSHIDTAYQPSKVTRADSYYGVGAAEVVDGALVPRGWEELAYDGSTWQAAVQTYSADLNEKPGDFGDPGGRWRLVKRDIPPMFEEPKQFKEAPKEAIPANAQWSRIYEAPEYSIGYPKLRITGGKGASVRLVYSEALAKGTKPEDKGVRDSRDGTDVTGYYDTYHASGGDETYVPFQWRTFRFVKLIVETSDSPLTIEEFSYSMTGYPWNRVAEFTVADGPAELQTVMDTDFRTLSRCTTESFMDCPYYEQLQYIGDTRLQALLSYVLTGDTRLGARAVRHFDWSRIPEGLTQSRYPSFMEQVLPPFSLIWVLMVEDLLRYSPDNKQAVIDSLLGCEAVLHWFTSRQSADGVLEGKLPWWNFVDWSEGWPAGVPAPIEDGKPSATLNLQLLAALQSFSRVTRALGETAKAQNYEAAASRLSQAIQSVFWNNEKKLLQEGPRPKWGYSQHAQAWGILTDVIPSSAYESVVESLHTDDSLVKTTFYHTFYIIEALAKVGRLEQLWSHWLAPWRDALKLNLSTWPETPEPSRSDCHAWSAWPTYAFLTHVLGCKPESGDPSPKKINGWSEITGKVATPNGLKEISVKWSSDGKPMIKTAEA